MEHTVDARGLSCPLPLIKARAALPGLGPGDELVVLATDPEAPIDLAALAADAGLGVAPGGPRGQGGVGQGRRPRPPGPRPRTHAAGPDRVRYLTDEYVKSQTVV